MLLKCPKSESLLQYFSIPEELPVHSRLGFKAHLFRCRSCQERMEGLRRTWEAFFTPEPDITDSLMRIYSRLQKDETLILKGWKLRDLSPGRPTPRPSLSRSWVARGAIGVGFGALMGIVAVSQIKPEGRAEPDFAMAAKGPLARIRYEDKNTVKVRYVQPELLQSIEFETTSFNHE